MTMDKPQRPVATSGAEPVSQEENLEGSKGVRGWIASQKDVAAKLKVYGLSAVLSYGLFDLITYSGSFLLAVRGWVAAGKLVSPATMPQILAISEFSEAGYRPCFAASSCDGPGLVSARMRKHRRYGHSCTGAAR
jgi:hypothetical protein